MLSPLASCSAVDAVVGADLSVRACTDRYPVVPAAAPKVRPAATVAATPVQAMTLQIVARLSTSCVPSDRGRAMGFSPMTFGSLVNSLRDNQETKAKTSSSSP